MKKFVYSAAFALVSLSVSAFASDKPEQGGALEVADLSICEKVVGLECIDPGDFFPADIGNLSCFSAIRGAKGETFVSHTWFYKESELLNIRLPVRSPEWRTYSTKNIGPNQTGPWHVEIRGPTGESLKIIDFEIVP